MSKHADLIARYEAARERIAASRSAQVKAYAYNPERDRYCGSYGQRMEDMRIADAAMVRAQEEMAAVQYLLAIHFSDADTRFPG